ncbi:MAG: hypothetical protein K8T25_23865 [Planctomycetia bacterium]|nr:hypothetical protein [Planctomycetia bacterium]
MPDTPFTPLLRTLHNFASFTPRDDFARAKKIKPGDGMKRACAARFRRVSLVQRCCGVSAMRQRCGLANRPPAKNLPVLTSEF